MIRLAGGTGLAQATQRAAAVERLGGYPGRHRAENKTGQDSPYAAHAQLLD
jgi:hypothetical protein